MGVFATLVVLGLLAGALELPQHGNKTNSTHSSACSATCRGLCHSSQCYCPAGVVGALCRRKTCPVGCNGHGYCHDGNCVCQFGWTGEACAQTMCPNNCSGHGICNAEAADGADALRRCYCDRQWKGESCQIPVCAQGPSGYECFGEGRCVNGVCFFVRDALTTASLPTLQITSVGLTQSKLAERRSASCTSDEDCPLKQYCLENVCVLHACRNACGSSRLDGVCVDNVCVCAPGRGGYDCSQILPVTTNNTRHHQWCERQFCILRCRNHLHKQVECIRNCDSQCALSTAREFFTLGHADRVALLADTRRPLGVPKDTVDQFGERPLQALQEASEDAQRGHVSEHLLAQLQQHFAVAQNED